LQAHDLLTQQQVNLQADSISSDTTVAKVSAVGIGMKSHSSVAHQFFDALAQEGIHIVLVSTSEIKVSVLIDEKYLELAVRALHSEFLTENG